MFRYEPPTGWLATLRQQTESPDVMQSHTGATGSDPIVKVEGGTPLP